MKITFKNSKLQEGTVKISFDGGNEFREYELAEVKDTGIELEPEQDLDKIKIKGPANILKNLEVISDIKLDSEGKQTPTIKNETEHYYAWVPFEDGEEESDDAEESVDYPFYYMTKTLIANEITAFYVWYNEYDEDSNPIIEEVGSFQELGILDIHQVVDNKIAITIGDETIQLVHYPSKDTDHIKTTITSMCFVMDNDLGKFPYNVTSVIVPEGVTEINGLYEYSKECITNITNKSAFSIYPNLKNISLPSSIKSIGYRSFAGCHGFSINIPDGTNVSGRSFSGSTPIEIIANQRILGSIGSRQHEYIQDVDNIGNYAYQNCTNLTEVDISKNLYDGCSIDKYAFRNCTNLKKVTTSGYGSDVLKIYCIGRSAFENCKNLESFDSLNGVEQIDDYAFLGCENLEITIPEGLTKIGERAFDGCKRVYLTMSSFNDKPDISRGFYGCNNVGVNISDSLTEIPDCAFEYYSRLKSVIIPESVNKIGEGVFSGCEDLTYVEIPENITQIGKAAFKNCASLTNIDLPGDITEICSSTFQNCTNLTELEIPESVTEINDYAFDGCTGLTNINLPDNLTKISPYTFRNCTNLTDVYVPESTTEIGESAYEGCTGLTSITILNVNSIGQAVFQGCTSLTSIDIPYGVTSISKYAFNGCTNLTSITISDDVTSIGESSFGGCTNLETINYTGTQEQWDAIEKPEDWNRNL